MMKQEAKEKRNLKGYYGITFLIGLGFFTMGLMDPLYDTFVPIFLGKFINSNGVIGTVMTLDNVLAIFLIPVFAALSDRTRTKIGRRMPYIIICLPIAAVAFGLIPWASGQTLILLIIIICILNLFKQAVRGPVVALMPDIIPGDLRSEANGVINTMGGIATIVGTVLLARLMDVELNLGSIHIGKDVLAFPVSTILVILAVILMFFFVKEDPKKYNENKAEDTPPVLKSIKFVFSQKDKSALFILLSLLCWFLGYQGALPFLGKYSKEIMGTSSGTASLAAGMVGIAYALFAIPSGKFAHNKGRKKTIRASLIALIVILCGLFVHSVGVTPKNFATLGYDKNFEITRTINGKEEIIKSNSIKQIDSLAEEKALYSYQVNLLDDEGNLLFASDEVEFNINEKGKIEGEIQTKEALENSDGIKLDLTATVFGDQVTLNWNFNKGNPINIQLILFWLLLFCFGIFWVSIVTNSFPMLWQMASYETIGIFTGLYYFFSQLASIIAPPITGFLSDGFGYGSIFLFAAFMMLLAFLFMSKVHKGEPEDDPMESVSKEK